MLYQSRFSDSLETFYESLRSSQLEKLNTPLNKYFSRVRMQTEFLPITNFDKTHGDLNKTPTNVDSGFIEGSSSGTINNSAPNRNSEVEKERTRGSTPHSHGQTTNQTSPQFSPLRSNSPPNNARPTPNNLGKLMSVKNKKKSI